MCELLVHQDLSTIGPRRYESKTVPGKSAGKLKRKLDSSVPQVVAKKAKGLVERRHLPTPLFVSSVSVFLPEILFCLLMIVIRMSKNFCTGSAVHI